MSAVKKRGANPSARAVFAVILLLVIAAFILFAVFTPRKAEIADGKLRFKHLFTSFEVPLDGIASAELLETRPSLRKVSGIGVFFLSEGKYDVDGYGRCTVSLNQSEPPFIAVTAEGGETCIFSLNDQEATEEFYGELAAALGDDG